MSPAIHSAELYRWRQPGSPNRDPVPSPANMTFQYFQGSGLPYPDASNPADHTANAQGVLWSDNAIRLDYRPGNTPQEAILIYTDNNDKGDLDPIGPVALRGGLVGGAGCNAACLDSGTAASCSNADRIVCAGRASVAPLVWKALPIEALRAVSDVGNAGPFLPNDSPVWMPTEVENQTGGPCPAEGPYNQPAGAARMANNGFCDFSTHYMLDKNNKDPNNLWYAEPAVKDRLGSFLYASVVGPYGVNITERGLGNGRFNPAFILLGMKSTHVLRTTYRTTIFVEVLSQ